MSSDTWQKFLDGDKDAFSELYSFYINDLFAYGLKIGFDEETCKDAIQDVMEVGVQNNAKTIEFLVSLDVIDPKEMKAAVGTDPDGMKIDEVTRVINDIYNEFDLGGLTVAEQMPRVAIKIRNMFSKLPLLMKM